MGITKKDGSSWKIKSDSKAGIKKTEKGYRFYGKKARAAFAILVFLFFISISFRADQWENTYNLSWIPDNELSDYSYGSCSHVRWDLEQNANLTFEQLDEIFQNENYDEIYIDFNPDSLGDKSIHRPVFMFDLLPVDFNSPNLTSGEAGKYGPYPYLFFHNGFQENYFPISDIGSTDPYTEIFNNPYNILVFDDIIQNYGKSMMGVYSIGRLPRSDSPGMLWNVSFGDKEIKSWCVIPDLDNDGANDLFISVGKTPKLPSFGEGYEYRDPNEFFFVTNLETGNIELDYGHFEEYFELYPLSEVIYGNPSNFLLQSRIEYYQNFIYSGLGDHNRSSRILVGDNEDAADFYRKNVYHAIFNKGPEEQSEGRINGTLVLLTGPEHLSKMAYYLGDYSAQRLHSVEGYSLDGKLLWSKNLNEADDLILTIDGALINRSGETFTFDLSKDPKPVKLVPINNGLIALTCFTNSLIDDKNNMVYLDNLWSNLEINYILNASTGKVLWGTYGHLTFDQRPWYSISDPLVEDDLSGGIINPNIFSSYIKINNKTNEVDLILKNFNAFTGKPISHYVYRTNVSSPPEIIYNFVGSSDRYFESSDNFNDIVGIIFRPGSAGPPEFLRVHLSFNTTDVIRGPIVSYDDSYNEDTEDYRQNSEGGRLYNKLRSIEDGTPLFKMVSVGYDVDFDGVLDYYVEVDNDIFLISGSGVRMFERPAIKQMADYNINYYSDRYGGRNSICPDFRESDDVIYIFRDPGNEARISAFHSVYGGVVYYEDINSYSGSESFDSYFYPWSLYLNIAIGVIALAAILIIKKDSQILSERPPDKAPKLTFYSKILLTVTFVIFLAILIFFLSLDIEPKTTDIFISRSASLYWFFIIYPLTFVFTAIIPPIFNYLAPRLAESVFIRLQRIVFSIQTKKGNKEYKVLVMNINEREYMPTYRYISRSILPFLIGLTLGINIYTGLAEGGWLLNLIRIFHPQSPPLTNPSNLGVWSVGADFSIVWVEMGKYARYMVFGLLISFFLSAIFIAPAWLLDDAGMVYYIKWKKYRGVNDIDSISSWILNSLQGIFGLTAVVSWLSLFKPLIDNLDALELGLSRIRGVNVTYGIVAILLALLVFPIFATLSIINSCNRRMEQNIIENSRKLFDVLEKRGYDLIPKEIESILKTKDSFPPGSWTEYFDEIGTPLKPVPGTTGSNMNVGLSNERDEKNENYISNSSEEDGINE